jgi:NAD(P)-dependent dehydrogenase (short-subunit alcohol dehydrogenase family)
MMNITKETVFITGVSSGLGYGLAKIYLERGARVIGCSRRMPEDLVERGLAFVGVDLANESLASSALAEQLEEVESLDIAILNAAKLGEIRDMREVSLEDIRETMEINVFANKWLLDLLFTKLTSIRQVVAISSGASRSGNRGWNGYSLSKAALNMLVKLYAAECPDTHFCAFAPGLVDTPMQDYLTNLPKDARYAPLEVLKSAKGTDRMPDGETCARELINILPQLLKRESGSYAHLREL